MNLARMLVVVGVAAAAGGCGPTPESAVDPGDAATHLRAALDAWKAGEPHAALEARNPPIVFNEPLWRDGATLIEYDLGDVELHGRQGRCTVRLRVKDAAGKSLDRRIGYLIDTSPRVVIGREGLGP